MKSNSPKKDELRRLVARGRVDHLRGDHYLIHVGAAHGVKTGDHVYWLGVCGHIITVETHGSIAEFAEVPEDRSQKLEAIIGITCPGCHVALPMEVGDGACVGCGWKLGTLASHE